MTARKNAPPRRAYSLTASKHEPQTLDISAGVQTYKQRKVECERLNKVFGERMYRARHEVNGWTQEHTAKLLGWKNSSPLAKIEAGGSHPRWLPVAASRVLKVSLDYLMGEHDLEFECRRPGTEWEQTIVDANKAFFKIMLDEHAKHLSTVARRTGVSVDGLAEVLGKAMSAKEAFDRVRELNPDLWEEARGGSRLENAMDSLYEACQTVRRRAERAKVQLKSKAISARICEAPTVFGQLANRRIDSISEQVDMWATD